MTVLGNPREWKRRSGKNQSDCGQEPPRLEKDDLFLNVFSQKKLLSVRQQHCSWDATMKKKEESFIK